MTNYNDGKWHGWNGGECPVHPQTIIEYVWEDHGRTGISERIAGLDENHIEPAWSGRLKAFRVIREHVEPREVWFRQGILSGEWHMCREGADGAVLFREVQP